MAAADAVASPSQQAPVEWNVAELDSQIRDLVTKEKSFNDEKLKPMAASITALAENLKKMGPQHDAKVARLRAVLSDVANVTTEVNAHVDALGRAQGELSMEAEPTDFAAVLADGAAAAPDAHGGEAAEMLAEFDRAVTDGAEDIEDDEVQFDRGADLAPNAACPMTSKGILEIEEPVEDQKGFVYEKAAIIEHIRKHGMGGEVACPHHGTNHRVSLNHLREARRVVRAQRSKQRRAELQSQIPGADSEDDDVLDID